MIPLRGGHLRPKLYRPPEIELAPADEMVSRHVSADPVEERSLGDAWGVRGVGPRWTAARVLFDLDGEGRPTGFVFEIGGDRRPVKRVE